MFVERNSEKRQNLGGNLFVEIFFLRKKLEERENLTNILVLFRLPSCPLSEVELRSCSCGGSRRSSRSSSLSLPGKRYDLSFEFTLSLLL